MRSSSSRRRLENNSKKRNPNSEAQIKNYSDKMKKEIVYFRTNIGLT